ncbi:MAG: MBL fold metallo-hydrolase [Candidatus Kapaibacterium sp.]
MRIRSLCAGPVDTNAYLIIDEESGIAVAVDTPMGSAAWFIEEARRHDVSIAEIWLTHSHWDHTADCEELRIASGACVRMHVDDEYRLLAPNDHVLFPLPYRFTPSRADFHVHHGDIVSAGTSPWQVRHVPGHTEGSVCFIHHDERVAIVGDTLFNGSIGRTDLPGGDHRTLIESITRELLTLADDYVVLAGHMGPTTIGDERTGNPFLHDTGSSEA